MWNALILVLVEMPKFMFIYDEHGQEIRLALRPACGRRGSADDRHGSAGPLDVQDYVLQRSRHVLRRLDHVRGCPPIHSERAEPPVRLCHFRIGQLRPYCLERGFRVHGLHPLSGHLHPAFWHRAGPEILGRKKVKFWPLCVFCRAAEDFTAALPAPGRSGSCTGRRTRRPF